jgi:hypothetical protein
MYHPEEKRFFHSKRPIESILLYHYATPLSSFDPVSLDHRTLTLIDLGILNQFLNVLRRIEDGELDQHEGSFVVGTLLKELYVDSALRKADKLNEREEETKQQVKGPAMSISWNEFKKSQL